MKRYQNEMARYQMRSEMWQLASPENRNKEKNPHNETERKQSEREPETKKGGSIRYQQSGSFPFVFVPERILKRRI